MSAIYRILTDQRLVEVRKRNKIIGYIHSNNLNLDNKQASLDALSFTERTTMHLRNRHKIYRRHECIWCGNDLGLAGCKTGKMKVSCGQDCGQSYRLFMQRLESILESNDYPKRLKIFVEYCLIQMIFRVPAKRLKDQLNNASKWKPVLEVPLRQKHANKKPK